MYINHNGTLLKLLECKQTTEQLGGELRNITHLRFEEPLTAELAKELAAAEPIVFADNGQPYMSLTGYTQIVPDRLTLMVPSRNEQLSAQVEQMQAAAAGLDDKAASQVPALFPMLKGENALIRAGQRVMWQSGLVKAAQDLWDVRDNWPDMQPGLWVTLDYVDGVRKIKPNATAADAFAMNEKGWWEGKIYISKMDGNVYTPETAPTVWTEVIEGGA